MGIRFRLSLLYKPMVCFGCIACLSVIITKVLSEEIPTEKTVALQSRVEPEKSGNLEETHSAVVHAIEHGDHGLAVLNYKRLLDLDPQLKGGYTDLSVGQNVTFKSTLKVAQDEVARLFRDLPALETHVTKDDAVYQWVVTCFAGRDSCNSIIWNSLDPAIGDNAEHRNPTSKLPAELRIRKRRTLLTLFGVPIRSAASHDEVWFSLVFELYNCQNYRRFHELRELSRNGILARDSFIAETLRTELDAELKAKAFYVYEFYPLMQKQNVRSNATTWRLNAPLSHAERIIACRVREGLWDTYGREYDELTRKKQ